MSFSTNDGLKCKRIIRIRAVDVVLLNINSDQNQANHLRNIDFAVLDRTLRL